MLRAGLQHAYQVGRADVMLLSFSRVIYVPVAVLDTEELAPGLDNGLLVVFSRLIHPDREAHNGLGAPV